MFKVINNLVYPELSESFISESSPASMYTIYQGDHEFVAVLVDDFGINFVLYKTILVENRNGIYKANVELNNFYINKDFSIGFSEEFKNRLKSARIDLRVAAYSSIRHGNSSSVAKLFEYLFLKIEPDLTIKEIPENQWIRDFLPYKWKEVLDEIQNKRKAIVENILKT